MSEKEVEEIQPIADLILQKHQLFSNKCAELGLLRYNRDFAVKAQAKASDDFELAEHNILVDIEKLAKEHDSLQAKQRAEDAAKKAEVMP